MAPFVVVAPAFGFETTPVASVKAPAVSAKFAELGFDAVGNSSVEASDLVSREIDRWAGVIKSANIKAN